MRAGGGDQPEKSNRLECANEKSNKKLSHECGIYVESVAEMPHYFDDSPLINGASVSIGIGKIVVEFFSAAISTSVCRYRS